MTSPLDSNGTTDIKPEMELHMINTIYAALPVRTNRKDDIFMQRRLVQNFTIILE